MVSSRSRGQATTCGQCGAHAARQSLPESALAVSSSRSSVTVEAEVSGLPALNGLENLDTAQPDSKNGAANSPAKAAWTQPPKCVGTPQLTPSLA